MRAWNIQTPNYTDKETEKVRDVEHMNNSNILYLNVRKICLIKSESLFLVP